MVDDKKRLEMVERSVIQRAALKRIEHLAGDSEWNLLEQLLQDIESVFVIRKEKIPSVEKLIEFLKQEIEVRFEQDSEVKGLLLDALPSQVTVSKWRKKKGWEEAVWLRVRHTGLFTSDKRQQVINQLYIQATEGNVNAAKVWLTLSGDYSEKADSKNEVLDQFREINNIIHGGKKNA